MATVKADAHFVDSDINPLAPVTWQQTIVSTTTDVYNAGIATSATLTIANSDGDFIDAGTTARNVLDNGDGTHRVGVSITAHGYEIGDKIAFGGQSVYQQNFDAGDENNPIVVGDTVQGSVDSKNATVITINYATASTGTIEYTLAYERVDNTYDNNEVLTASVSGNQITMDGGSTKRRYSDTASLAYTVVDITDDEVFFNANDPFQARTFLGTEAVTRMVLDNNYPGTIKATPHESSDTDYIIVPVDGTTSSPFHYMDKSDWSVDSGYFDKPSKPAPVVPAAEPWGFGIWIDPTDSDAMYGTVAWLGETRNFVHKYKISDGSLTWQCADEISNKGGLAVLSDGSLMANSRFGDGSFSIGLNTINPSNGGFLANYPRTFDGAYAGTAVPDSLFSYVDPDTGFDVVVAFDQGSSIPTRQLPLSVACDLEGGDQFQWTPTPEGAMDGKGWDGGFYHNGYIYFYVNTEANKWALNTGDANVFRFKINISSSGNASLGSFEAYEIDPIPNRLQSGISDNYIWGILNSNTTSANENSQYELIKYDDAMNVVTQYETNYYPSLHQYFSITGTPRVSTSVNQQDRTVAYPQDHAHLEGQEVQVLSDGIYLDDDTYTISSGDVSPAVTGTNNHIGLQVVSTLQPMKIDGDVNVKRIRQIIPDVFESAGGQYGKELDDLYTMELRTTNDIMERDNALYSGYVELPYKGQYDRSGDIWIKQDIPLPLNVLGIGVRLSKEDI